MPTYEYRCTACQYNGDLFHKISEPARTLCPQCGMNALRRGPGGGNGLQFKGSGFYINDYRSRSPEEKSCSEAKGSCSQQKGSCSQEASPPDANASSGS